MQKDWRAGTPSRHSLPQQSHLLLLLLISSLPLPLPPGPPPPLPSSSASCPSSSCPSSSSSLLFPVLLLLLPLPPGQAWSWEDAKNILYIRPKENTRPRRVLPAGNGGLSDSEGTVLPQEQKSWENSCAGAGTLPEERKAGVQLRRGQSGRLQGHRTAEGTGLWGEGH